MARLIEDLLDVSRISRGHIRLQLRRVSLPAIVEEAVEASAANLEGSRHLLRVSLPEGEVEVDADPTRLAQVLLNLLDNAVKFTPPGGRIEVVTECRADEAVVLVRDTGVGIDPVELASIFQMFHQAGTSRGPGLGIGLALTKALVDLNGGRIEAHSPGLGQGAEFRVFLPRCAPRAEALGASSDAAPGTRRSELDVREVPDEHAAHAVREPPDTDEAGEVSQAHEVPDASHAPAHGPHAAGAAAGRSGGREASEVAPSNRRPAAPIRVLLVDDNADALQTLAMYLRLCGLEVRCAEDGPAALAAAAEFAPHAVGLDIGLPGMSGYEVAERLRAEAREPRPLLIALTGWGQAEDRRRALRAGFDHHFTKPVDLEVLLELLLGAGERSPGEPSASATPGRSG